MFCCLTCVTISIGAPTCVFYRLTCVTTSIGAPTCVFCRLTCVTTSIRAPIRVFYRLTNLTTSIGTLTYVLCPLTSVTTSIRAAFLGCPTIHVCTACLHTSADRARSNDGARPWNKEYSHDSNQTRKHVYFTHFIRQLKNNMFKHFAITPQIARFMRPT